MEEHHRGEARIREYEQMENYLSTVFSFRLRKE